MATFSLTPSGGGGDYSLLSEFLAAEQANFDGTEPFELLCTAGDYGDGVNGGLADPVVISGWSPTDPTNNVTIKAATPADKYDYETNTGFYLKRTDDAVNVISIAGDQDFVFEDIGIRHIGNRRCLYFNQLPSTATRIYQIFNRCVITAGSNVVGSGREAIVAERRNGFRLENCVIANATSSAYCMNINVSWRSHTEFDNCTFTGFVTAGDSSSSTLDLEFRNCVLQGGMSFARADDMAQTTLTNCGTGDASFDANFGTVTAPQFNVDETNDYVDFANGNYTPESGGKLQGNGTSPPVVSTDFTGATRNDPDDIGAYVAAGGPILVKEMYVKDSNAFVNAAPNLRIGGAWQEVEAHVRSGGVWVKVHDK